MKNHFKHLLFGLAHLIVAVPSILLVTKATGVPIQVSFIAVGLGTLLFHWATNNQLSSVLGLSASYLGGVILIASKYGIAHVKGGVIGVGVIYLLLALTLKYKPNLLRSIPKYIYQLSVVFIALLLIPIGFNLMNTQLGYMSLALLAVLYRFENIRGYAMPITLALMALSAYFTGSLTFSTFEHQNLSEWLLVAPKFNLYTITSISLVSLAVIGETLGDISKTAEINKVKFGEDVTWSQVFLGNGLSNIVAGLLGSNPVVSYTESNSFLATMGHDDLNPIAQVYTSILFIILAFVTPLIVLLQSIPVPIFGALLFFLFVSLLIDTGKSISWCKEVYIITALATVAFFTTKYYLPTLSPITGSFIVSLVANCIINKFEIRKVE